MKVHVKKKRFQEFCRNQVKQGLINQANGTWAKAVDKWTDKHMLAGYKFR